MLIYSFIPARKGSKRIPNKNIKKLNGIPLINYTINHCLKSKFINKTFVSSNDNKLLNLIKGKSIYKIKRPNILSGDTSSTEGAVLHFITYLNKEKITLPDLIVLLQCTSPKRHANDIDNAINIFKKKKYDSLFTACSNKNLFWKFNNKKYLPINYNFKKRLTEQRMKEQYVENGSFYIFKTKKFIKHKSRLFENIGIYLMSKINSFQLDDYEDMKILKKIL